MTSAKPVIAAVGAGRMGRGIAQVFAYAGHDVALIDIKERPAAARDRVLAEARAEIAAGLSFLVDLKVMTAVQADETLGRITFAGADAFDDHVGRADFVFEAVPEVLDVKEACFTAINRAARPDAVITSTTSTILVDTLAAFVERPERFLNAHWLNPAPLVPLVEVSPADVTDKTVVDAMVGLLERAGKVPVVCGAAPGFIVPRVQALAMNEAARLVEEGVASAEDVDKAIRAGFGIRFAVLGLVEFIDWGGGDILYYASEYLKGALNSDRFDAPAIVKDNMAKGAIGMKTGQGFYDYEGRDLDAYRRETLAKFVDLLQHLDMLPPPGGKPE
jgi:3-hydroxybutyryl-CoA dehydrogenase